MTNKQGMNFNELKLTFVRFLVANRQIVRLTFNFSSKCACDDCKMSTKCTSAVNKRFVKISVIGQVANVKRMLICEV